MARLNLEMEEEDFSAFLGNETTVDLEVGENDVGWFEINIEHETDPDINVGSIQSNDDGEGFYVGTYENVDTMEVKFEKFQEDKTYAFAAKWDIEQDVDDLVDDDREVLGEEFSFLPAAPFSFSAGLLRCVPCVSSFWQGSGLSQQCLVEVEVELVRVDALGAFAEEPLLQPGDDLVFARQLFLDGGGLFSRCGEFDLEVAEPGEHLFQVELSVVVRHAPHLSEMSMRRTRIVSICASFFLSLC